MAFEIKSSAFVNGGDIPKKFTCDGSDISVPLSWSNAPAETKSFALISDDPDAPVGDWVHWVVWNIPQSKSELAENFPKDVTLPDGTTQGINSSKNTGWDSPCPPSGTHRYFFKLYALDTTLALSPRSSKKELETAIRGHVLAQAVLMGKYSRQR